MKTFDIPADGPNRRLYIISLLIFLQALKVADFLALRAVSDPKLGWFLLKWFFLDTCFIYALPYLNIPWLRFRRSSQLLQIMFVLILNWGLSFGWGFIRDSGLSVGVVWTAIFRSTLRSNGFVDDSLL
jgi:hypothetical protein